MLRDSHRVPYRLRGPKVAEYKFQRNERTKEVPAEVRDGGSHTLAEVTLTYKRGYVLEIIFFRYPESLRNQRLMIKVRYQG